MFVYDAPMPDPEAETHFTGVFLLDGASGQEYAGVYLISGDEYIDELADTMTAWGYTITWEYAEPGTVETAEAAAPLTAYILHVIDQNGDPVPGMMVNFCTDTACVMVRADENGTIVFDGAPDVYHVQMLKAPGGYSFDADFEMYTDSVYGEWALRIRKD